MISQSQKRRKIDELFMFGIIFDLIELINGLNVYIIGIQGFSSGNLIYKGIY
jgi:hypothetical protein